VLERGPEPLGWSAWKAPGLGVAARAIGTTHAVLLMVMMMGVVWPGLIFPRPSRRAGRVAIIRAEGRVGGE